jgi:hypothetical protein
MCALLFARTEFVCLFGGIADQNLVDFGQCLPAQE